MARSSPTTSPTTPSPTPTPFFDRLAFEYTRATIAIADTTVSIAATAATAGTIIASNNALNDSHQSDYVSHLSRPYSDSIPDQRAAAHSRPTVAGGGVSIVSIADNIIAAIAATTTGGDITRARDRAPPCPRRPSALFSSRHATSIAIRHALASTADADAPADITSDPTRRYSRETATAPTSSKPPSAGSKRTFRCLSMAIQTTPQPQTTTMTRARAMKVSTVAATAMTAPLPQPLLPT